MRENVPVNPSSVICELTVVLYLSLETSSIYKVSDEVIIHVEATPVPLLMMSIHLDTLTSVGPVSPRTKIGSDLYIVSRFTFLSQMVGETITTPVPEGQYCCDVVKLVALATEVLPTISTAVTFT